MFTQQEASALRQKFWISFGRYISPIPSVSGDKVNWINYRTGIKFISFRMDATTEFASVAIEISHKDAADRELYFNHFKTFKKPLEELLGEKCNWEIHVVNDSGNTISRISTRLEEINVHRESDWPSIITFLKNRIVALDAFWTEYKEIFEMLN